MPAIDKKDNATDITRGTPRTGAPRHGKKPLITPKPYLGITAAVCITIVGTVLWFYIGYRIQLPWISLLIAIGAAYSMRYLSGARHFAYGIIGAALALLCNLAGNLFTAIHIVSKRGGKSVSEIVSQLDLSTALSWISALARPVVILIYLGAIGIGFWFAFTHEVKSVEDRL